MTLKECYDVFGGNYENVFSRLRSEKLILKFVFRFLEDPSYELLCKSIEEHNDEEAFRAAHTIKGICQNLGFDVLLKSSSEMADAYRHGKTPDADQIFESFKKDYQHTISAIQQLKQDIEG